MFQGAVEGQGHAGYIYLYTFFVDFVSERVDYKVQK